MMPPPDLSEKAWQQQLVDLAHAYGWELYHTYDSRRSAPGFPDLVLIRPPALLFVEVKTEKGRTTPAQDAWLAALRACGVYAEVWRPSDFGEAHTRLRNAGGAPAALSRSAPTGQTRR